MAGEGGYLRKARQTQSLTLADVEEVTKIRRTYLQAIEDEAYGELPGDAYVRGFLRNYARTLSLDPDEIVRMYSETAAPSSALAISKLAIKNTKTFSAPLIIMVVIVLAITAYMAWLIFIKWNDSTPNITYGDPGFKAPSVQQQVPAQNNDSSGSAAKKAQFTVELKFEAVCWIWVKADDQTVIYELIDPGETRSISAYEKVDFVEIGAPSGLVITVNGKVFDKSKYVTGRGIILNMTVTRDG
ncbi:MAG: DUF4115 domain-containing protein [Peptococcaceae bacterium]|jgi:cytoskeletal protein RodZ|nr:DUF4115 domain-containing protein [Peptococcaceae bacterium]